MLDVIKIVLPVIMMLIIGKLCNRFGLLSKEGSSQIKKLMVNVVLPVAVFHAMATGTYSLSVACVCLLILGILAVSLAAGYLLRPLIKGEYGKYLPFVTAVFEGGMIAYPLYSSACGSENLSNIASLDIANCIFCFSVVTALIKVQEEGSRPTVGNLLKGAFTNPTFDAALIGIIVGLSGVMDIFLPTSAGAVYEAMEATLTASLSPMILLVVGFDMTFDRELLGPCIKAVAIRVILQLILMVPSYYLVNMLFPGNELMRLAILIYMIAPPSYSIPAFVKKDAGLKFMATVNSIYCLVTVLLYSVILTMFL